MFRSARSVARMLITALILAVAVVAGVIIWNTYVTGPFTRDGQVLADVVNVAPEVSGRITKLHVSDNQTLHKGDVLYEIDQADYRVAVASAQAQVNSKLADLKVKRLEAARRTLLTTLSTSEEERQSYDSNAEVAAAAYAGALAQLGQAHIDLDRTTVLSPVNGYVTNLLLREGDYATKGSRNISLLDSDSFWVAGYFEETKLGGIHIGDPALAALMGFGNDPIRGHVESIARGINTPDTAPGSLGLASVNPVFTWVRLAQRIPVHIHIDSVPASIHLAAGMTATVTVGAAVSPSSTHGMLSRLVTQRGE